MRSFLVLPQSLRLNFLKASPTDRQNAAKAPVSKLGQVANPSYGATRSAAATPAQNTVAMVAMVAKPPVKSPETKPQPKKAAAPKTEEAPKKSFSERMGKRFDKVVCEIFPYTDAAFSCFTFFVSVPVALTVSLFYMIGAAGYEAYQSFKN